jgi:hypothetical protein
MTKATVRDAEPEVTTTERVELTVTVDKRLFRKFKQDPSKFAEILGLEIAATLVGAGIIRSRIP